jgi:2-methylcitrate dehydratase PrpD
LWIAAAGREMPGAEEMPMSQSSVTQRIAAWVAEVPRSRTLSAAGPATDGLRDVIGCMLAGSAEAVPRNTAAAVRRWGNGTSRVIGTGEALAAPWAALVNGAAAHVLDYDDTFEPLSGHATAVLAPAILALGEEVAATGPDLLDALVVGLEVMACVGRGVNPKHYQLGWHATSTIGAIGAAGACARLLKLDAARARDALSLGVSMAAGTRMQLGADAKSVHAGLAAKSGILAATLATEGVGGAPEGLEGQWRFAELFAGRPAPEGAMEPPAEDAPLAVQSPGLSLKAYPTCAATHLSLDALLALRARERFAAEEVEAIESELPLTLRRNLMHDDPRTGMQARFSMTYALAAAAVQGEVGPADFEGDAIFRPALRAVMPRVSMRGLPEPEGSPPPATTVTLRLRDGRVLTETRRQRRGSAALPLSAAEQEAKFRACASRVLSPGAVERALGMIGGLAGGGDARGLVAALVRG